MNLEESNNAYNDPDVYRILSTISEFQEKGKEVTPVWVPAHVGIPGNEQSDALAKAALLLFLTSVDFVVVLFIKLYWGH